MVEVNPYDPSGIYANALRIIYYVYSILGLIFTSTLLIVLYKKQKKSKSSDTILTIVAVSVDCVASGGLLFRAIFSQYPYNILKEHPGWCSYDTFVNSLFLSFSGYILSIVSIQRMLIIVFNLRISIWIWLLIAILISFTIWGQTIYQIVNENIQLSIIEVFCYGKNNAMGRPIIITLVVYTLATYFITIISYISIIIFSCKQCLKQLDLNLDKSIVYKECRVIVFKSLFFLIPYILIYSGRLYCWLYEFATGNTRTFTMEYVSIILVSSCVVVNCLTILYMNKKVNTDFINFLKRLRSIFHYQSNENV
jgi:hypothetical protein